MSPEDILNQSLFNALTEYGLPDDKAAKLAVKTTERARRSKSSGPFTRPGVLISDRIAEGRGIEITIRRKNLDKVNPHEVLKTYLERAKIKGEWTLEEAFGEPTSSVKVWIAKPTPAREKEVKKKASEKLLIQNFNKLSPDKQKEILQQLQRGQN